MTDAEILKIKSYYVDDGLTYKEIQTLTGRSAATLCNILRGMKTFSEARLNSIKRGRQNLTENGRLKLSENGKKAYQRNGKFWTVPEQNFKTILNELGLGVRFPEYIKVKLGLRDDDNPKINFQFPIQRYVCDFVEEDKKIVYQVNGDFWHANPLLYDHSKLTKIQKVNVRQDTNRAKFLDTRNYTLCILWESEIKWRPDLVKQKIWAARGSVNPCALHAQDAAFDSQVAYCDWSEQLVSLWFKKPKIKKEKPKIICDCCGVAFVAGCKRLYCSIKCSRFSSRKIERPNRTELQEMLWSEPTTKIASRLGVSDKAVKKWADIYKLSKPPRGYWAKINILRV